VWCLSDCALPEGLATSLKWQFNVISSAPIVNPSPYLFILMYGSFKVLEVLRKLKFVCQGIKQNALPDCRYVRRTEWIKEDAGLCPDNSTMNSERKNSEQWCWVFGEEMDQQTTGDRSQKASIWHDVSMFQESGVRRMPIVHVLNITSGKQEIHMIQRSFHIWFLNPVGIVGLI